MPTNLKQATQENTSQALNPSIQYYQEGVLNPSAWFGIVEADYRKVLDAVNWDLVFGNGSVPHQLLDIGCGTGKFPRMLRPQLNQNVTIDYDYLDPSPYSLSTCQRALQPPYQPRRAFQTTLEDAHLEAPPNGYDMVWAIQSLYCLDQKSLFNSMNTIHQILNPHRGTSMIILAKRDAFFHQLYELYALTTPEQGRKAYLTAESVLQAISQVGMPSIIREIECTHTISIRDERGLDQYLQQCVMDNRPSRTWRNHPLMRDFLDAFRHVDVYRFPNPIWVILSAPKETKLEGRHRLQAYLEPVSTQLVA